MSAGCRPGRARRARRRARCCWSASTTPPRGVATKTSRTDLVSDADRAAERACGRARRERPDDAVVAEEGGGTRGSSGLRWVVDPLDGTINYLWGLPFWAVSVAVEDGRAPWRRWCWTRCATSSSRPPAAAARTWAGGAWRCARATPSEALTGTGFSYRADQRALQAAAGGACCPRCATSGASARRRWTSPGWPPAAWTGSSRPAWRPGTGPPARCWCARRAASCASWPRARAARPAWWRRPA